jgi:hypothetical protein
MTVIIGRLTPLRSPGHFPAPRIALISLDKWARGWHLTPLIRTVEDGAGGRS